MRAMVAVLAVLDLGACDVIFPLTEPTTPAGDGSNLPPPDGGGLLNPPVTSDVCPPALPAFGTWQFTPTAFPYNGPPPLSEFSLYKTNSGSGAIVTNRDAMFDVDAGGAAQHLPSLDPPPAAFMGAPRVTYDGDVLWFAQTGIGAGVYLAARATGWTRRRADLGFPNAERIEPGTVGFFASSARMVVAVANVGGSSILRELSSLDGEHWIELDTVKLATSGLGDRNPTLSPDGCSLLYLASDGTNRIELSVRDADGSFTSSQTLANISSLTSAPSAPVLSPDQDVLWITSNVGGDIQLFRGQP